MSGSEGFLTLMWREGGRAEGEREGVHYLLHAHLLIYLPTGYPYELSRVEAEINDKELIEKVRDLLKTLEEGREGGEEGGGVKVGEVWREVRREEGEEGREEGERVEYWEVALLVACLKREKEEEGGKEGGKEGEGEEGRRKQKKRM